MNWPDNIIEAIVTHLITIDESASRLAFQDLQSQVEQELNRLAEAWRCQYNLLGPKQYREKYNLLSKEMDTACELGFLETVGRKEIPQPFFGVIRLLYHDKPLTPEQLQQVRDDTYLSTSKAAAYLGLSTAAFRKLGMTPTVPPWNQNGGYSGKFYRLSDLIACKDAVYKKHAPSVNQQKAWNELNERQRTYLLLIYREEKRKEPYYTSYAAMDNPKRKGGEWRWCEHDSSSSSVGLDGNIAKAGLLDQGTGSTYEALERRGLIERRHRRVETIFGRVTLLDVRLTRKGRALAKTFNTLTKKGKSNE